MATHTANRSTPFSIASISSDHYVMSHEDSHSVKVTIPILDLDVQYEHWRTCLEGVLMTRGIHQYIKQPLAADAPDTEKDKRTRAFGFILCYLRPGEKQAISAILKADTQDAHRAPPAADARRPTTPRSRVARQSMRWTSRPTARHTTIQPLTHMHC